MRFCGTLQALIALAAGAAAAGPALRDDPRARMEAMRQRRADTPESRWTLLREAAKERDRWAIGRPRALAAARSSALTLQGPSFVSLGPTSAEFEENGGRYFEVDSGRARQIVVHPVDPQILYLATSGGGVWRSWDAGQDWEPITDALGTTSIGTFAMDPQNPDILFIGFGDPFDVQQPGIVRSGDAGATWSDPIALTATYASGAVARTAGSVTDIQIDPRNSANVLVATDAGLFRSTDGGATFRQVPLPADPKGNTFFFLWSLAWVGGDNWLVTGQVADISTASTPAGTGALVIFRSSDAGATWAWHGAALPGGDDLALAGGRGTLATAAGTMRDAATSRVFLLVAANDGASTLDLFRSDDGGRTFQALGLNAKGVPLNPNVDQADLDVGHGQAWYNQALLADPLDPDAVFVGGDLAVLRSQDGGLTWSVISDWLPQVQELAYPYIHADVHAMAAGADGTLYVGSDGGIFASANARSAAASAVTFSSAANDGLVTHLVLSVACAPEEWPADQQSFVAGGMQDNGTRVRSGSTTTFNQVLGGDGVGMAVGSVAPPGAGALFYASAEFQLFLSRDGGQTWGDGMAGLSGFLPFFVRVVRDTAAGDAFLTFTHFPAGVYRSVGGGRWQEVSGKISWPDGTTTTGFVAPDGATIALSNLAAHPSRPFVWAAVSNRYSYSTVDGGSTWTAGKPIAPSGSTYTVYGLSSIAYDPDPGAYGTLYATTLSPQLVNGTLQTIPIPASFGHLYKSTNFGRDWAPLGGAALPNVGFDVVKVDPSDPHILYVGTQLGLYRSGDKGQTWARFGAGSLPLVEVRDLCITANTRRLTAATYGRGFWQITTDAGATTAGVRGVGDTNFDGRIDGLDLIDLADAYGSTQASPTYRWQADIVGAENRIDDSDLAALLAKFGGRP